AFVLIPRAPYCAILLTAGLLAVGRGVAIAQAAGPATPVGTWRGESKCITDAPACHDEHVVYYIEMVPDTPAQVKVRADKIVDGKAVTMGAGPWNYDSRRQELSWESSGRLWLLALHGDQIDGTLTMPDKIVFRRMTLTRDHSEPHPQAQ
ncbi:MAG TPA: hypothetical protein VKB76_05070, partial [Ktedonobacterales bacterium]|nr:hypothetical protein [Ktedonobacterales bacterium]